MDSHVLADFISRQRWFAGKGRRWDVVRVEPLGWLQDGEPRVRIELVTVRFAEGDEETYQLPLEYRSEPADHLSHALVGEVKDEDGVPTFAYDALHDKQVTGLWLRGIAAETDLGSVAFHREPAAPEFPLDEASIVVGAEQSNTSLVFGDAVILKVFRKVSFGLNPDIEVHSALARAGSDNIATPLGWIEGRWRDGTRSGTGSLAMLQNFLRSAAEGWELAKASVRDLYAEADLHADEVGGDFAGEAHRLGRVTAEVHADLAATLPTAVAGHDEIAALVGGMTDRLDAAVDVVPELGTYADALRAAYADLTVAEPVVVQRVHGDFHLGQVMRTLTGWKLLDFEGEPARPLEERRALSSPLRDVAGMLRSLDYAARHLLAERSNEPQLEYRAEEWATRNRAAFCNGYAEVGRTDPRAQPELMRALETEKAVYEVVYEARNRPSWLPIPMSAIRRLAGEEDA